MGRSGRRKVVFKEFEVRDSECAMKVGTDALLLGAWAEVSTSQRIIDGGTGCGIVALMVCQRATHAQIIGVELEPKAVREAKANMARSPWSSRISAIKDSLQSFGTRTEYKGYFDTFLINPPFFHGKPKSSDCARNLARHDDSLPIHVFLDVARDLLNETGSLQLIWPWDRWQELKKAAEARDFSLLRNAEVHGRKDLDPSRVLSHWVKGIPSHESKNEVIWIETGERIKGLPQLSKRYKALLNPYVVSWPGE